MAAFAWTRVQNQTSVIFVVFIERQSVRVLLSPALKENLPSSPLFTVHLLSMPAGNEGDIRGPKRQERKRRDLAMNRINTGDLSKVEDLVALPGI